MNYTELTTKFWSINEKTPLGASAIALYLFLLEEYRKNEDRDFSISDNVISQRLSLTRPTIIAVKSKLRNMGLIQYQAKKGLPSLYRILSDFSFLQEQLKSELVKNNVGYPLQEAKIIPQPVQVVEEKEVEPIIEEKPIAIETPKSETPPIRETTSLEKINIPTLEEFMAFAKTTEIYDESMDFQIKAKYESWVDAGWKNGLGMPLIKWQNNLKNTLPHMKRSSKRNITINNIPTIKRPKTTYNE